MYSDIKMPMFDMGRKRAVKPFQNGSFGLKILVWGREKVGWRLSYRGGPRSFIPTGKKVYGLGNPPLAWRIRFHTTSGHERWLQKMCVRHPPSAVRAKRAHTRSLKQCMDVTVHRKDL